MVGLAVASSTSLGSARNLGEEMMMRSAASVLVFVLLAACASPANEGPAKGRVVPGSTVSQPAAVRDSLAAIAGEVSPDRQRAAITRMVGFGTRSTISDTVSDTRGIGAARRWVESEFKSMGAACGGCLEIVKPSDIASGGRFPKPTEVVVVAAIQKGTSDPNRVIIIQGHLDSRNSDPVDGVGDAPGANDDASGVAAVLETARILSKRKYSATLVYAALSGEEQGLHGGRILAAYAKAQGWQVEAVLNNDIVGNSHGASGIVDDKTVRVFSEGVRAVETADMQRLRRLNGGEVDSPSRNLARYLAGVAEANMKEFRVRMIYRMDRFGRGGDHARFQEMGFTAVRITEGAENYTRQHQNVRVENGVQYGDLIEGVDFTYLANVTRLNAMAMASMASAPPPPLEVSIEGQVSPDTTVTWKPSVGAGGYVVRWRDTTSPAWQHEKTVPADTTKVTLPGVVIDDWFFGVAAVSPQGFESPTQFAGPVGAFWPLPETPGP